MKTILILDNSPAMLAVSRWLLHDYNVILPESYQSDNQAVDLLIADVGSGGVLIAMQLHLQLPELRILFTGSYPPHLWLEPDAWGLPPARVAGLEKPFFPAVLRHKIHELIG